MTNIVSNKSIRLLFINRIRLHMLLNSPLKKLINHEKNIHFNFCRTLHISGLCTKTTVRKENGGIPIYLF